MPPMDDTEVLLDCRLSELESPLTEPCLDGDVERTVSEV